MKTGPYWPPLARESSCRTGTIISYFLMTLALRVRRINCVSGKNQAQAIACHARRIGFCFGDTIPIPARGPPILPLKPIICAALGGRYLHQLSIVSPLIPARLPRLRLGPQRRPRRRRARGRPGPTRRHPPPPARLRARAGGAGARWCLKDQTKNSFATMATDRAMLTLTRPIKSATSERVCRTSLESLS